jgi:hypothetical protein
MVEDESKFLKSLQELKYFRTQGDQLNVKEFEEWKAELIEALDEPYRSKFRALRFYEILEDADTDIITF